MSNPFAYIAVYIFLERDGKILWMRRANTGYRDGFWSLPAGHVEVGESIKQAIVRETFEEAGINIAEDNLKLIHAMYRRSDRTYVDFYFKATVWDGEPKIMEPHKCDGLEWVEQDTFLNPTIDEVQTAWKSHRQGISLSEIETRGRE